MQTLGYHGKMCLVIIDNIIWMLFPQIYDTILFFTGSSKSDFDARWKNFHIVKNSLEDKVNLITGSQ